MYIIRNKMEEKRKEIQPVGYRFSEEKSRENRKITNHQTQSEESVNKLKKAFLKHNPGHRLKALITFQIKLMGKDSR